MKKILLVDDCKTTRKIVSYLLKGSAYTILQAENGLDALEKLARNDVDIIITDLNMPRMDGIEFVKVLKEDDAYMGIPVIMLTTEGSEQDKDKAYQLGVVSYLSKPVDKDRILNEIEKYCT